MWKIKLENRRNPLHSDYYPVAFLYPKKLSLIRCLRINKEYLCWRIKGCHRIILCHLGVWSEKVASPVSLRWIVAKPPTANVMQLRHDNWRIWGEETGVFPPPGTYTVTVTAWKSGSTATASFPVTVVFSPHPMFLPWIVIGGGN